MLKKKPNKPENWNKLKLAEKKQWCHENRVICWEIHKTCEEHGLRYLWLNDFFHPSQTGTCCHPVCLSKQVSAFMYKPGCGRILKFAEKLCGRDAIIEELIEAMLRQIKAGRVTVIHYKLLYFVALGALRKHRLQNEKEEQAILAKEAIAEYLYDESLQIGNVATGDTRAFGNNVSCRSVSPESVYNSVELSYKLAQEFGVHWMMYLLGELSVRDVCRIDGIKPVDVEAKRVQIQAWYVRHFK